MYQCLLDLSKKISAIPDDPFRPVSLKYTVYCSTVSGGGANQWNFFWKKVFEGEEENQEEKINMLAGLACSKDIASLEVGTSFFSEFKKIIIWQFSLILNCNFSLDSNFKSKKQLQKPLTI